MAQPHDGAAYVPVQRSLTAFPKRHFPVIHRLCDDASSGHLPVTIMREPDLVMSVRRRLTALVTIVLVCGGSSLAQAQSTSSKSTAKPATAKPEAAAAGGAEPTLIGQFGTWGAYTATPNGKKVCFALAKPS